MEYIRGSHISDRPREHRRSEGRFPFEMLLVDMDAVDICVPDLPELLLSVPLRISEGAAWRWEMEGVSREEPFRLEQLMVLPPHTVSRWNATGRRSQLFLIVPPATVVRTVGSACPMDLHVAFSPLTTIGWEDPLLRILLTEVWDRLGGNCVMDRLFIDGAVISILSRLLQRAGTFNQNVRSIALHPSKLKRVLSYIESHLTSSIEIVTLANIAGISPRHFGRVFWRETGETPHNYVMMRRVERAKSLIVSQQGSLEEIAKTCGFADQSHFTRSMKKAMNITPDRWRRLLTTHAEPS
ncbi:AraC family transcriptional regulator [Sphingobium boeckii]|uniref:AraC family transcriptional regulator n=1 Tax=Sphingobium boeckii TaxID=1082345 RepID=A0A7W9AFY0_9SPHN|nr:AraC family transcriptional regulator [Sphingobium boeckii]MBB5684953.1 AraC family transcriptional regulator [Sphingobium boeckii]